MMMIELKVDSDPRVIFECAFLLDEGFLVLTGDGAESEAKEAWRRRKVQNRK